VDSLTGLQPPIRAALGDAVADILRNAILDGSLKPGQPLHENTLARQLSVSRSPVREALMRLERERLVVSRLNRPTIVRRPSPEEINQVYTIRSALEGIAARWAADKATPAFVSQLRQKAEDLHEATVAAQGSEPGLVGQAIDFHAAIAEGAGSQEIQQMLQCLCNQIRLVMTAGLASLTSRRAEEIHAEHLAIIAAIAEQDGDQAERLATAHVRAARDRLVHQGASEVQADSLADHASVAD
jgi:DNA-binding GntR family transcriptional regulator